MLLEAGISEILVYDDDDTYRRVDPIDLVGKIFIVKEILSNGSILISLVEPF